MNWQSDFLSSANTNNTNNSTANMNNQNSSQPAHFVSKSTITLSPQQLNHYHYHTSPPPSKVVPTNLYSHSTSPSIIDYSSSSSSNITNNSTINNNNNIQTNNYINLTSSSSSASSEFLNNNSNNNLNMNLNLSNTNNINLSPQNYHQQKLINNNSSPTSQLTANAVNNKHLVAEIIEMIRSLKIKLLAFDFDCTIVTIHTGGQWIDSPEKLAEFVRPCFRELLPALLKTPDLYVCVVTYSPQEQLIREVLRISMKDELAVNDLVNKIVIKGNTKEFLQQYGIENCFSQGKQIHLKYCRNYFESFNVNNINNTIKQNNSGNNLVNMVNTNNNTNNENNYNNGKSNKENLINDSNILLIDDDIQNLKLAFDNGHLVFQVNNTMKLIDFYNYLKDKRPVII